MRLTFALVTLCLVPTILPAQTDESIEAAVAGITTEDVASRVHLLAADSMRGRNTPSPELETAAKYIAAEFQRFGLAPGGDDGTFLQRYPITQVALDTENSHVTLSDGTIWRIGEQLLMGGGGGQTEGVPYLLTGGSGDAAVLDAGDYEDAFALLAGPSTRTSFQPHAAEGLRCGPGRARRVARHLATNGAVSAAPSVACRRCGRRHAVLLASL